MSQYRPGDVVNGHVLVNSPNGPVWVAQTNLTPVVKPRRKRRVFLWFFLAVQVLFIIWMIGGISASSGPATDCGSLSQSSCDAAAGLGHGIGFALVLLFWVIVDFLLGVGYAIYRLATRP